MKKIFLFLLIFTRLGNAMSDAQNCEVLNFKESPNKYENETFFFFDIKCNNQIETHIMSLRVNKTLSKAGVDITINLKNNYGDRFSGTYYPDSRTMHSGPDDCQGFYKQITIEEAIELAISCVIKKYY